VPLLDANGYGAPLVALLVIAGLGLVLRWTFSRDGKPTVWPGAGDDPAETAASGLATPIDPAPRDYGLLTPVTVVDTRQEAELVREQLARASIRATMSTDSAGRYHVLVFANDADRARSLLT
jgi:hypothetical protein